MGGITGHAAFLEAIADPKHEERDDMWSWVGRKFAPEKFSVDKVNKELRRV